MFSQGVLKGVGRGERIIPGHEKHKKHVHQKPFGLMVDVPFVPFVASRSLDSCPCESLPMRVKRGRYMAMTREPMVTSRKAIKRGSIRVNKLAMAESTSDS